MPSEKQPSEAANPRDLFERYVADPTEANAALVRQSLLYTIDAERARAEAVMGAARRAYEMMDLQNHREARRELREALKDYDTPRRGG